MNPIWEPDPLSAYGMPQYQNPAPQAPPQQGAPQPPPQGYGAPAQQPPQNYYGPPPQNYYAPPAPSAPPPLIYAPATVRAPVAQPPKRGGESVRGDMFMHR